MTLGMLLCLVVILGALLSLVVPLPGWVDVAFFIMLAVAYLTGGVVLYRR